MSEPIPKIIHQTWKDAHLPADYARWRDTVTAAHPDWEHRLWTDADNRALIAERHPWFLDTYDGYAHGIERADAARYFILLEHGGVYLDLDMECLKPIDPLLKAGTLHFGLLAGPTIDNVVTGNALMAAPRGHAFFAYLTKRLPHVIARDITFSDVFRNTGPEMVTRHVALFENIFPVRIIGLEHVCDRCVLADNPATRGKGIEAVRTDSLLHFIHHHTNVWNVQHPPPEPIPDGFTLFENRDIFGCDIAYVEYAPGDYGKIVTAAARNEAAVAFNYNGYVKGRGGRLETCTSDLNWVKPGITPWICVKDESISEVA